MTAYLDVWSHEFSFPAEAVPPWSGDVERWYQLDAYAFGMADAIHARPARLQGQPDFVVLASPGASNHTDALFARSEGPSPSLFVHSLPSIRGASLCQIMKWNGPVLCIQNDPGTCVTALRESSALLDDQIRKIWIVGVRRCRGLDSRYLAYLLQLGLDRQAASFAIDRCGDEGRSPGSDECLWRWLGAHDQAPAPLPITGGYFVRRLAAHSLDAGGR